MPSRRSAYDYVIVGAGSAGCVLANRLTEDRDTTVLLVEAGGRDLNPFIHMPAGIAKLVGDRRIDWQFYTEPERQLAGRRLYWPRGRVLGGSSSINAMCYTRGAAADYDEWAAMGLTQWGYRNVLPYFRKAERHVGGASEYHGDHGPLVVEDLRYRNPLSTVFVEAAAASGMPRNDDFNGVRQEGFGYYQVTQNRGRRCSAATAYLHPVRKRPNLTVITRATTTRVLVERGRAVGIEYRHRGQTHSVHVEREVLLAAGAVSSPQLLMLSGIGPPAELEVWDIPVAAALNSVGENLQDHLDFCTLQKCTQPITYDFGILGELAVGLRYLATRSGPGVSNVAEAGGFARSPLAPDERADLQFHFVPAQLDDHGRNRLPGHGYTLHVCVLRPESRGRILLRSASVADPPRIEANYLSDERDLAQLVSGVRLSREILAAAPFDPYRGAEVFPGSGAQTDQELAAVIREKAETIYHPVGTCRMGIDADSVVDAELRVRGIERLRVIDASVMPSLIGGNTNAPTIMIAEKIADILRGRTPEGQSQAPIFAP
ncbi:MAG: choline dehydrogenase [Proteobacteria bacterium]|nr:choline dehydrogenase [Pseudomonadota bacterium]